MACSSRVTAHTCHIHAARQAAGQGLACPRSCCCCASGACSWRTCVDLVDYVIKPGHGLCIDFTLHLPCGMIYDGQQRASRAPDELMRVRQLPPVCVRACRVTCAASIASSSGKPPLHTSIHGCSSATVSASPSLLYIRAVSLVSCLTRRLCLSGGAGRFGDDTQYAQQAPRCCGGCM